MTSWRDRRTELALLSGGALTALYFAVPDGAAKNSVYGFVGFAAFAAILWGARDSVPWILFAAGTLLFSIGDDVGAGFWAGNPPVPSAADAFYLAGYPLLAVGLVLLLYASGSYRRTAALADAVIVTLAFLLVQWVYLLDGILSSSESTFTIAVNAAYPLMDLILLAGLAGFFVTAAWRTPAFWLLALSVTLLLVADEVFAFGSYMSGDWIDAGWLLSYTLWAAAALHVSRRELSQPSPRRYPQRLRVSPFRVGVLLLALLAAPAVLLIQDLRHSALHVPAIVAASAAISVFVLLRLTGILRALEGIRARERAARAEAEQAQRLLEAQNERLVEADRLKDEFVALISHDLRTPLTSIMGYIELALDDPLADDTRSYLEVVARSSQRLVRLVDDLLFVARLQSGRLELNPSRLDLNELARQAAEEARGRAGAKDLDFAVDSNGAVPIDADRGRMFQLLDNLISNAIKFTPDGGKVEINVSADRVARLEVCDTGIGFTTVEAGRVFERFYRTDRAVERQVPGTGLGLFIAHAITNAHGGRIDAMPREGGGAVFRVELPLAQ